ncbi:lipoprotein [Vibrio sp. V28_P6S34P95]
MKKIALTLGLSVLLVGCDNNEVGDVSLGLFTMNDLHSITQLL